MHCTKAKQGIEDAEAREFAEKRWKYDERERQRKRYLEDVELSPSQGRKVIDLAVKDLDDSAKRFCMYIGSFSVAHSTPGTRAEFVKLQLYHLREPRTKKPVLFVVNLKGIKVCNPDEEKEIFMAHALKRISYSTCDPANRQFAFLARNPSGPLGVQYCHCFLTRRKEEAEEINVIIGKAFKVAYASLRSKKKFFDLVTETNREHAADFDSVGEKMLEIDRREHRVLAKELEIARYKHEIANESERQFIVGQGKVWAKQIVGRVKHKTPYLQEEVLTDVGLTRPDTKEKKQDSHPMTSPANVQDIQPSAPPLSPAEQRLSDELVTKQTKRGKPLPPAPYCDMEIYNEWNPEVEHGTPVSPLVVSPETHPKGMQILLQDEQPPPALRGVIPRNNLKAKKGQILLQDQTPPPQFQYPIQNANQTVEQATKETLPVDAAQDEDPASRSDEVQRSKPPGHLGHKVEVDINAVRRSVTTGEPVPPPLPARSSSSRSVENNAATEFSHLDIHDRRITHEENLLKNVPWFQSGIPREIAMEILQQDEIGAFVVRNSGSHPGCYALSMKVTKDVNRIGIVNYLIEYKNGKYTLKGSGKVFPDLTTLINYYSMNRDLLPCRLNLARTNPIYHVVDPDVKDDLRCDEDESDEEDDQDYLKLSDFTTLMNEIRPH